MVSPQKTVADLGAEPIRALAGPHHVRARTERALPRRGSDAHAVHEDVGAHGLRVLHAQLSGVTHAREHRRHGHVFAHRHLDAALEGEIAVAHHADDVGAGQREDPGLLAVQLAAEPPVDEHAPRFGRGEHDGSHAGVQDAHGALDGHAVGLLDGVGWAGGELLVEIEGLVVAPEAIEAHGDVERVLGRSVERARARELLERSLHVSGLEEVHPATKEVLRAGQRVGVLSARRRGEEEEGEGGSRAPQEGHGSSSTRLASSDARSRSRAFGRTATGILASRSMTRSNTLSPNAARSERSSTRASRWCAFPGP